MTVTEYCGRFLQLARYAPAEVANDGDKQERFREGLDDHIEYALLNLRFDNFNHLVDSTLNTERKRREIEDKKRKMTPAASGSNTRPRYQQLQEQQQQQRSLQPYQPRHQQYPPRPSSSSRRGRARGFQHLWHAQFHRLQQLRGRECLLLLPDSRLQHSHGRATLWRAGTLRQRLSPEGAIWTAGAPSSAQGAITGQGEPRDGRVGGRGSQRGDWYVHG
jgi:hypothetical protein